MTYPFITLFCLLAAWPLGGDSLAIWLLVLGQASLLTGHLVRGQVTAVGAFLFMSFLFFGVRALYVVLEGDYRLFTERFRIAPSPDIAMNAAWWGTVAMLCFHFGSQMVGLFHQGYFKARQKMVVVRRRIPLANDKMVLLMVVYQVATIPLMMVIAGSGRSIYGSSLGAYMYQLPMLLQAGHVFALVVILERWIRVRDSARLFILFVSGALFLIITWIMRDVSNFRGFYITGVMVAGIAMLVRMMRRVSLLWVILPIVLLQPAFRILGESRNLTNEELASRGIEEEISVGGTILTAYWSFYDSKGDMNIFDTFAGATVYEPAHRPYLLSWLYVPVHLVPRAVWPGKPKQGILQDVDFMYGAPYSPGIAGFFLLDGGFFWMLGSMFVLGYLVSFADQFIFTMPHGYLRCCLLGIVVINSMFLSRFYLWQAFYQILYAIIPCIALAWILDRKPLGSHFGGFLKPPPSRLRSKRSSRKSKKIGRIESESKAS